MTLKRISMWIGGIALGAVSLFLIWNVIWQSLVINALRNLQG